MDDFTKIATRVAHLTSVGFITGTTILNYFFDTTTYLEEDPNFASAKLIAGVTIFVTGILTMKQLKGDKELEGGQTVWSDVLKFKVVASLFLNNFVTHPLIVMLVGADDEEAQIKATTEIHFYVVVTIMLVSILNKAYREEICNNFEKDPFHEKLDEIKNKYNYDDPVVSSDDDGIPKTQSAKRDKHGLPIPEEFHMGIPTTETGQKAAQKKKKGTSLPMKGEMKQKLDAALKDLKDVYGEEALAHDSREDDEESGEEVRETGIKLTPMPNPSGPNG